jgi:cyclohexa-1,5-dienecarbonyl-CoA hydratase
MTVHVSKEDHRWILTVEKPPLNVLDLACLRELGNILDEAGEAAASGEVRLVALRGAGEKAFSAGVAVQDHTRERVPGMLGTIHGVARRLRDLPVPTVAIVHGHCLGGGFELALCCDMMIAADDTRFATPEIKLGCFPPIATALLPRRIGRGRALELILSGRTFDVAEAERLGLVLRSAPRAELDAMATALMDALTAHSAAVSRHLKTAVAVGEAQGFDAALDEAERIYLEELLPLDDMEEGLNAFLEKRAPVWQHR